MMEMQPLAGKSLSHTKLYHRKNYFVLALFIPLSIHSQPRSAPGPRYRSYPKLVQAPIWCGHSQVSANASSGLDIWAASLSLS